MLLHPHYSTRCAPLRATTEVEEQTVVAEVTEFEPLYDVIIIDNPVNTYDEVIVVIVEAIACTYDHAFQLALEVDRTGAACVATVELTEARRIAGIIRRIGIEVRVEPAAL